MCERAGQVNEWKGLRGGGLEDVDEVVEDVDEEEEEEKKSKRIPSSFLIAKCSATSAR
jgi:hypothetical protein